MPLTFPASAPPLLFLSPRVPWPLNTGAKIRTHALLRALCEAFPVHYAGFLQPDLSADEARRRLGACETIKLYPEQGISLRGKAWLACRALADSRPVNILKYDHGGLRDYVSLWIQENPAGLVHADHLHMAACLGDASPVACVIDEHNVESVILERMASSYHRRGLRPWLRRQARRMADFEARTIARRAQALAVSPEDAARLEALAPGARVTVVPNGVDLDYFTPPPPDNRRIAGRLVFTGSMDWLPNQDAVMHFLDSIWPRLPRTPGQPPWQFDVVGRSPSAGLRARSDAANRVTGAVPDIRPFLHEAMMLVVPLRIGGGSRLKILEAFAAGLPVVSSRVGCEGLEVEDGRHLLIADEPEAFAAAIARLHGDEALRHELAAAGRRLAQLRYDWRTIGRDLVQTYQNLISAELAATPTPVEAGTAG